MYIFSIPRYAVKPTMNPDLLWALLTNILSTQEPLDPPRQIERAPCNTF